MHFKSNSGETRTFGENLFNEIDQDNDGLITIGELRDALERIPNSNFEQYFKKYDRNSDAKISLDGLYNLGDLRDEVPS